MFGTAIAMGSCLVMQFANTVGDSDDFRMLGSGRIAAWLRAKPLAGLVASSSVTSAAYENDGYAFRPPGRDR
jgi:hypothetical protein